MASASPSPNPSANDLPLSRLDFTCRLPVSLQVPGEPPQGAFIDFPSGALTLDPKGKGGVYYDRAFSKWLPQPRNAVSPDGRRYAYGAQTASNQPILHVITVATGADRVYRLPSELYSAIGGTTVFDFANDRVYLGWLTEGSILGVWVVDLVTGTTRKITVAGNMGAVDGQVAWFGSVNPKDPNPLSFPPGAASNQINRLDLVTGKTTAWLYRPGTLLSVLGIDAAHHPIVQSYTDPQHAELLVLVSPTTQALIYSGAGDSAAVQIDSFEGGMISDGHGTWFGSGSHGLYLYAQSAGLKKVSAVSGLRPANGCF